MNLTDVRMVQRRNRARFLLEPTQAMLNLGGQTLMATSRPSRGSRAL